MEAVPKQENQLESACISRVAVNKLHALFQEVVIKIFLLRFRRCADRSLEMG